MPTITFSAKDFTQLLGKKISNEELTSTLAKFKAEVETITSDEITVQLNDTNLPFTWCMEGLAILSRGTLGISIGIHSFPLQKSTETLMVDPSVKTVRPFIAAFTARGPKLTDEALVQLIQYQEKIADQYGNKREKIAIGLYPAQHIQFPVLYKAVPPTSVSFVPLETARPMNLQEILTSHPKGTQYKHLLANQSIYPILLDAKKNVLSFPPIINSNALGKLTHGDQYIFFEATGTEFELVNHAAVLFAYVLALRGYTIHPVIISSSGTKKATPVMTTKTMKLTKETADTFLGIPLTDKEFTQCIKRARYDIKGNTISIPPYRPDIMHAVDIIEDIGIQYGYERLTPLPLTSYTPGKTFFLTQFIDHVRTLAVGLGYQEVFSAYLTNKDNLYTFMNIPDTGTVEIDAYVSESYSVVRSWITPQLFDVLSQNKHVLYPQKLFEQGIITHRNKTTITEHEHIALLTTHANADFTEIKQALDWVFRTLGILYTITETEHASYVPGRVGRIIVNNIPIGTFGEYHPTVLKNWGLTIPVSGAELDLTTLFHAIHQSSSSHQPQKSEKPAQPKDKKTKEKKREDHAE